MKYRTRKTKPATGMEMSVTLSMPADYNVEQCTDALLKFIEGVRRLSSDTAAPWVKIHCSGIPEELEQKLASAIEPKRPNLELVVNNRS